MSTILTEDLDFNGNKALQFKANLAEGNIFIGNAQGESEEAHLQTFLDAAAPGLISTVLIASRANIQSNPSNPGGVLGTTPKMQGLALMITPGLTGMLMISISGYAAVSIGTGGIDIRYGTGTAPANQDALTGTSASGVADVLLGRFTVHAFIYATVGVEIWIDLAVTGGVINTVDLSNLCATIVEV